MKLTKHLVRFERGDSLLLMNGATVKPLVIQKGKSYISGLLRDVNKIEDRKLIDFLCHHDIIVADNDDEDYGVRNLKYKLNSPGVIGNAQKTHGLSIYLLLSQSCNLGCVYCLNGDETYKKSGGLMMPEEVAFRGIDRFAGTILPQGTFNIVFFGGEPLLNWKLAKKIIAYCEEKVKKELPELNVTYHLTSNLTFLPPDLIEMAKRHNITFLCNVDGERNIHNATRPHRSNKRSSYDDTVESIEKLRKAGLEIALRATITSVNMNHIKEVSQIHKDLGGAGSAFVSVNAVNSDENILPKSMLPDPDIVERGLRELAESDIWPKEDLFPLNEFLKKIKPGERTFWACGAPLGNTPVLDVNGDVYACIYLVGIERYKLGNIFSNNEYPDRNVIGMMMDVINIDNSPECRDCRLRYICAGGCPVGRFTIKDNPQADDEIVKYTHDIACKVNTAMIEESLWHYSQKASEKRKQWDGICY